MRFGAAVLVSALAIACANDAGLGVRQEPRRADRTVDPGDAFEIQVGEVVGITGSEVEIFFDGVVEDSRCPTGVQCPWEGNAAARFELSLGNAELSPQPAVLNTFFGPRETRTFGLRLRLRALRPYPDYSSLPIDPAAYVAELEATRS